MGTFGFFIAYIFISILISLIIAEKGAKKKIGYTSALLLSILLSPIIGYLIVINSSDLKPVVHRYKSAMEDAKKEEFKGNISGAIDKYKDAIFYLNNDYKNSNKHEVQERDKLIEKLTDKLNLLQSKAVNA